MDAQNARRVSVPWFTGDATDVSGLRSSFLLIRTIPGFRCERLHTFRRQIGVRIGPVPWLAIGRRQIHPGSPLRNGSRGLYAAACQFGHRRSTHLATRAVFMGLLRSQGRQALRYFRCLRYNTQLAISPIVAANMAITVTQLKALSQKLLTLSPISRRSLVISTIMSINGGVEKPWTIPA
jgi:hypothetical protein